MSIVERAVVIRAFLRALRNRNLIILAGLSGTGKTQLARRLARGITQMDELWGGNGLDRVEQALDKALAGKRNALFAPVPDRPEHISVEDPGPGLGASEGQTHLKRVGFLAVRPDWTDSKKVWGYYNPLTGHFYPTDALIVALNAYRDYLDKGEAASRYYILLDEMNLARVEHYFSDVLSLMESGCEIDPRDPNKVRIGETARVHPLDSMIVSQGRRGIRHESNEAAEGAMEQVVPFYELGSRKWVYGPLVHGGNVTERPEEGVAPDADERDIIASVFPIPPRIAIAPNLTILGTINVDETTHGFAPKVLDRAFLLEFDEVDYQAALGQHPCFAEVSPLLSALHDALHPGGRHFGYRVAREMLDYVEASGGKLDVDTGDFLLMGKVLPKLRGTAPELGDSVQRLLGLVRALGYPRSTRKLERLDHDLKTSGFSGFFR